ncbi:hypothetical protein B5X24_HaOG209352 [Helicoverpa armigera]|nr:hypothetical protein B5X24_HaOG209352 [Helicoverpa armigera]
MPDSNVPKQTGDSLRPGKRHNTKNYVVYPAAGTGSPGTLRTACGKSILGRCLEFCGQRGGSGGGAGGHRLTGAHRSLPAPRAAVFEGRY